MTGFLAAFLLGESIFEYYIFEKTKSTEEQVIFERNHDLLVVKVPIQLPYLSEVQFSEMTGDLVVFERDFFRSVNKFFSGDTLVTVFRKENITRQGVFEMLGQVTEDFDSHKSPLTSLNDFLKSLSKIYYNSGENFLVFFWNYRHSDLHFSYHNLYQQISLSHQSPPPIYLSFNNNI